MNRPLSLEDLTDPLVYDLLNRDHIPEEEVFTAGSGQACRISITCQVCKQSWPCGVRDLLQEYGRLWEKPNE